MPEYRKVSVESVSNTPNPTREMKEIDEAVGASEFGFNVVTADPGEQVPWGYHRHPDHEELFYVLSGELRVETQDGEFRVEADEAFFVPRDAPNRAVAAGETPCRLVAVGAPKDADSAIIEEECPACGETTDRTYEAVEDAGRAVYVLSCAGCGVETRRFE
ncbi:cupin domain-containing protein [Haloprofundus halobius]|uniref:cupin domain-containing protein n=1 Tax=Haloprofundus halobius TaxID=2876194 RepID=UPI001CC977A0|nr:cupin domain-containing protein [Haloprofundus halobius]